MVIVCWDGSRLITAECDGAVGRRFDVCAGSAKAVVVDGVIGAPMGLERVGLRVVELSY